MRNEAQDVEASVQRTASAPSEDGALVVEVVRGDIDAFETLFRRYCPRLRRFLERVMRRPQLVDEVLNDTMLVVWRKAATYNQRSKVSTWIMGIARRRGMKALKRDDEAIAFNAEEAISGEPGPEGRLLRQELRTRLNQALRSLPVEQRTVVELTYYQGLTYREIADIVGCPIDTVKTRMFHARRRLKAMLGDRAEEAA